MLNLIAVDDESDVKVLFEHFFKEEVDAKCLNLIFATSGKSCLERLGELGATPTVVLSDINMPEMSGIELLQEIHKSYPEVKVILISAYEKEYYSDEMSKWGAVDFVSKPVDFIKLKEKLAEYLKTG